jgi:release factor glutamine methyltransferase
VQLRRGEDLSALTAAGEGRFDLIVSNPPYIPTSDIPSLQPEVRDFDPPEALDGGADGLEFYRMLATSAGAWLRPLAPLMVELGAGQAPPVAALLEQSGWRVDGLENDYGGHERILIARRLD